MTNLLLETPEYEVTRTRFGTWREYLYESGQRFSEFRSPGTFLLLNGHDLEASKDRPTPSSCYTLGARRITTGESTMPTPEIATTRAVTVSAKGWIVIPAPLRHRYHIEPGQKIRIVDYGGVLSLVPSFRDPVREGRGVLAGETSLTRALLEERRKEKEREDR